MKTMVIGVYYTASATNAQASIKARFSSEESRADWFEARKTERPAGLVKAAAFLEAKFGMPVKFRFSLKAGCSMCPCSPGFELIAHPQDQQDRDLLERWQWGHTKKEQRYQIYEQENFKLNLRLKGTTVTELER